VGKIVQRYSSLQKLVEAIDPILPDSTIGEDNDGQIVIYTGLEELAMGTIVTIDPVEDENE
jgi:hypothetical protein